MTQERTVRLDDVTGKAILCGGLIIEWRKEWMWGSKKDY